MEVLRDDLIKYKSLSCKDYSSKIAEKLKKWCKNTFKFSNNNINKFILLFRKAVYPYEDMNEWETTLLEKVEFYSNVNMEDITDADCIHAKRVWNKKIGE